VIATSASGIRASGGDQVYPSGDSRRTTAPLENRDRPAFPDQSILAKAFRVELVPHAPRDEPTSQLLARIRTNREQAEATLDSLSPQVSRKGLEPKVVGLPLSATFPATLPR